MAQVTGKAGRFVSHVAVKKRLRLVLTALFSMGAICLICGISVGTSLRGLQMPFWGSAVISTVAFVLIYLIGKWVFPQLDRLEKERVHWQKGANGEAKVADHLQRLPDAFEVINDVEGPSGNLDHVVVGPTGVFILDAKDWRGIVSADGKGELLLNRRATKKREASQLVCNMMRVKDEVKRITHGLDPFFHAVLVFTSAHVEAKWGTTGKVHCIREDQIADYIVERKPDTKLSSEEIKRIRDAFLTLAQRSTDFTEQMAKEEPRAA